MSFILEFVMWGTTFKGLTLVCTARVTLRSTLPCVCVLVLEVERRGMFCVGEFSSPRTDVSIISDSLKIAGENEFLSLGRPCYMRSGAAETIRKILSPGLGPANPLSVPGYLRSNRKISSHLVT